MELLEKINLLDRVASTINPDEGGEFTNAQRLELIDKILADTSYHLQKIGLCYLYSKAPLEELKASGETIMVISSHVDTRRNRNITEPISEKVGDNKLRGAYDNSITNAAVLSLMLEGRLPANVLVAFIGNEKHETIGAFDLGNYIRKEGIDAKVIVTNVTDRGYHGRNAFTIENRNHSGDWTWSILKRLEGSDYKWKKKGRYLNDETLAYTHLGFECFSFCIPTKREMYYNSVLMTRVLTFFYYIDALGYVCGQS